MTREEAIRRLTILRDFLEKNVKPQTFDINDWDCGTTKCALGWACYIPEFRKLGLSTEHLSPLSGAYKCPTYKEHRSISAGYNFFGISRPQAHHIFMPDRYRKPVHLQDVCRHIDNVINEIRIRV